MSKEQTGYEGVYNEPPEPGDLKWKVSLIPGWSGRRKFGALLKLNGESVGILALPTEEAYECLRKKLESHP